MTETKKIRKNAKNKIISILKTATWEFFTHDNDYKGGEHGKASHINSILEDIQLGHAHLFQENNTYILRYAGRCRWVSQWLTP